MAKKDTPNSSSTGIEARVLVDCHLGKINDVVTLDDASLAEAAGLVDGDAGAVAFARSLAQG